MTKYSEHPAVSRHDTPFFGTNLKLVEIKNGGQHCKILNNYFQRGGPRNVAMAVDRPATGFSSVPNLGEMSNLSRISGQICFFLALRYSRILWNFLRLFSPPWLIWGFPHFSHENLLPEV